MSHHYDPTRPDLQHGRVPLSADHEQAATYSDRHPHEDRGVPPALRPDGGCEVCGLEVRIESLAAQLAAAQQEIAQAVTILGTMRPLDVMQPGEDLSIGECAERWRELIRGMVVAGERK